LVETFAATLVGLAMLYFGGEFLVRGASALALRLGVSALAIGLTVVAFGTSAPELVVSLNAALSGANDISVGNVVGSNIANIALILGVSSLLRPSAVHAKIVRIDAPLMILASLVMLAMLANGIVTRSEGGLLGVGLAAYIGFTFWEAGRETKPVRAGLASAAPTLRFGAHGAALLVAVGIALLVGGGHLLVSAAVTLATAFGVSQAVIGLTIVAVGTSLPELSTSVIAAIKGQGDIAIGNVIGSNLFNILGILGLTAVVKPLEIGEIGWLDLGLMFGLACAVTVFVTTRLRLERVEAGVLLAIYVLYSAWLLGAR
jgi:cation:H+ antiporter